MMASKRSSTFMRSLNCLAARSDGQRDEDLLVHVHSYGLPGFDDPAALVPHLPFIIVAAEVLALRKRNVASFRHRGFVTWVNVNVFTVNDEQHRSALVDSCREDLSATTWRTKESFLHDDSDL